MPPGSFISLSNRLINFFHGFWSVCYMNDFDVVALISGFWNPSFWFGELWWVDVILFYSSFWLMWFGCRVDLPRWWFFRLICTVRSCVYRQWKIAYIFDTVNYNNNNVSVSVLHSLMHCFPVMCMFSTAYLFQIIGLNNQL